MSATFFRNVGGVAGLALLIGAWPATAADGSRIAGDTGGATRAVGTQPEEYGNPPPPKVMGKPGTPASVKASQPPPKMPPPSKQRKLTGPGTQPGEYEPSVPAGVGPYDTVHNVRIDKATPHPESADSEKRKRK